MLVEMVRLGIKKTEDLVELIGKRFKFSIKLCGSYWILGCIDTLDTTECSTEMFKLLKENSLKAECRGTRCCTVRECGYVTLREPDCTVRVSSIEEVNKLSHEIIQLNNLLEENRKEYEDKIHKVDKTLKKEYRKCNLEILDQIDSVSIEGGSVVLKYMIPKHKIFQGKWLLENFRIIGWVMESVKNKTGYDALYSEDNSYIFIKIILRAKEK